MFLAGMDGGAGACEGCQSLLVVLLIAQSIDEPRYNYIYIVNTVRSKS
jgi:hypothetical protein